MSSLKTFMEKQTLSNLKKLTTNQYLVVTLEGGDVESAIAYSRRLGFLTRFFTTPYVTVEGPRTFNNEACLDRLRLGLPCVVEDDLNPYEECMLVLREKWLCYDP